MMKKSGYVVIGIGILVAIIGAVFGYTASENEILSDLTDDETVEGIGTSDSVTIEVEPGPETPEGNTVEINVSDGVTSQEG